MQEGRHKHYGQLPKLPEPPAPAYVLREADLRDMASKGMLKDQHFLIRMLAENMGIVDVSPSDH